LHQAGDRICELGRHPDRRSRVFRAAIGKIWRQRNGADQNKSREHVGSNAQCVPLTARSPGRKKRPRPSGAKSRHTVGRPAREVWAGTRRKADAVARVRLRISDCAPPQTGAVTPRRTDVFTSARATSPPPHHHLRGRSRSVPQPKEGLSHSRGLVRDRRQRYRGSVCRAFGRGVNLKINEGVSRARGPASSQSRKDMASLRSPAPTLRSLRCVLEA
jgi:hypothetical protein